MLTGDIIRITLIILSLYAGLKQCNNNSDLIGLIIPITLIPIAFIGMTIALSYIMIATLIIICLVWIVKNVNIITY